LIRIPAALLLSLGAILPCSAQQQNQLDASPALFTVMAAINAAGYDADLGSSANSPFRSELRAVLAAKNAPSIARLKRFFAAHKLNDANAELSQYVSYGLSIEGPPDFHYRVREAELPPDVPRLAGLNELLASFYQEADIESLWRKAQPFYERMLEAYHGPVSQALLETNGYLRNPTSGYLGRHFQIYVDLLGAPYQAQTRSYKDDYFVVVTPSPEPQIEEIRHAYLHYVLDPLGIKYAERLNTKKTLGDYAQNAPALDLFYKDDYILLATECVIKAVESRLAHGAARQEMVDRALREGFVLTPGFAEALPAYEKQERAMRLYFPELVDSLDRKREEQRLKKAEFVNERVVKRVAHAPVLPAPAVTGPAKTLADAEESYRARDLEAAKAAYLRALDQTADRAMHARAFYGLARIAALQRSPEEAQKLFAKTLDLAPDDETKSWVYVYLGRLADDRSRTLRRAGRNEEADGERTLAEQHYRAALAVVGPSPAAREAAEKALAPPKQNP
jgi:tetratricopeptide (TPR) repeat protein